MEKIEKLCCICNDKIKLTPVNINNKYYCENCWTAYNFIKENPQKTKEILNDN